jgi:hypothetical protein
VTPIEKVRARIAERDLARGRPLTLSEQLANLRHAVERICGTCGGEVEPGARCKCGHLNSNWVTI